MSSTRPLSDALDFVKLMTKNIPLEKIQIPLLNDAMCYMWMAAPWRWTIGTLPAIPLVANQQGYSFTIPTDFLYLLDCYLSDGTLSYTHLHIEPMLPVAGIIGNPNKVALVGIDGTPRPSYLSVLRLYPKPGTFINPVSIITLYKRIAPIITQLNFASPGMFDGSNVPSYSFDDEWFWVFQEICLWKAYLYADDQRAGSVTYTSDGRYQCTGQRANVEAALQQMREREKMPLFDQHNPQLEQESSRK